MSHENIVATAVVVIEQTANLMQNYYLKEIYIV